MDLTGRLAAASGRRFPGDVRDGCADGNGRVADAEAHAESREAGDPAGRYVFFPFSTAALKPEPIDVHAKIILIGDRDMYELLYDYEDDFKKIFKVRVEFDEEMKWSEAKSLANTAGACGNSGRRKAAAL